MSEYSESYHLRSERANDAVELLRRTNHKGYVFQSTNGWVTFVVAAGVFEPNVLLVEAAGHPLLHYVSAEDHGWSFTLFDRGSVISCYRCDWDDEIRVDDSRYSRAALEQYVSSSRRVLFNEFESRMHPKDFDELFEAEPSKVLAQALGLEHYDWLNYDYVARDFADSPNDDRRVTEVS